MAKKKNKKVDPRIPEIKQKLTSAIDKINRIHASICALEIRTGMTLKELLKIEEDLKNNIS